MAARRPNVLIVLMDQLQRGALGSYGCRAARTPVFDRLAANGLRLARAYVPLPQCAPARASMFTGRYPHQHQVYRVGDSTEFPADWQAEVGPLVHRTPLPESVPSLGQAFQAAGYRMGYTGPWHMGDDETPHHGWTDFWRTYRYWKDGRDFYIQHLERHGLAETFHQEHRRFGASGSLANGIFPSGASTIPVEHARTSWAVDQAIEFLDSRDERPWVFCCSIKDPHPPIISPGDFPNLVSPDEVELPVSLADDLSTKPRTLRESVQHQWVRNMSDDDWRRLIAHYHGLVAHVDTEVGRMLDHLQAEGLADDTIVVVLSDHGESLGAHRMIEKGPSMYEESLGIPFIVRWPGRIDAGRVSDALFSTIDLPKTLGNLCDVPVDAGEGRSFAGTWTSDAPAPRDAIFAEFYSHFEDQNQFIKTICTDRWKLNLFLLDDSELYDLQADPHEMTNLVADPAHAAIRAALAQRIVDWVHETGDPLAPIVKRAAQALAN